MLIETKIYEIGWLDHPSNCNIEFFNTGDSNFSGVIFISTLFSGLITQRLGLTMYDVGALVLTYPQINSIPIL